MDAGSIQVQVKNGEVTLTGEVDSLMAKRSAGDDACDVPGVKNIHNNLNITKQGGSGQTQQEQKQATK